METRRICLDDDDWKLIVAASGLRSNPNLPRRLREELEKAVWNNQDGYGSPGYTPTQGWDWSGIRDSSDTGIKNMASAIRKILKREGIDCFEY